MQHTLHRFMCPASTVPWLVQQVFALGFVSVFDQITEGLPGNGPGDIFNAYMTALQEDPEQYRKYSPSPPPPALQSVTAAATCLC